MKKKSTIKEDPEQGASAETVEELPSENLPAVQEPTQAVAVRQDDSLQAQLSGLGASDSLVRKAVKAAKNFELMENPRIPVIKRGGNGLILDEMDEDAEEVRDTSGVIIYAERNKSFYQYAYTKGSKELPDCYSLNGKVPELNVKARQNDICRTCKQNQFGSAGGDRKGKACRDLRRLFVLASVTPGEETIMPKRLTLTPTSLKNFESYLTQLISHGLSFDEVETKITARKKERDDTYVVLSFQKVKTYSEDKPDENQVLANIKALQKLWLPIMKQTSIADVVEDAGEGESRPVNDQPQDF